MAVASLEATKRRLPVLVALKILTVIVAASVALFALPAGWVERYYSHGLYPPVQAALTPLSNFVPFAVVDVLLIALLIGLPAWWVARLRRAGRDQRRRALGRLTLDTLTLAAVIYLTFLLLWGFNYLRRPLAARLDYDEGRITPQSLLELKRLSIERLNAEAPAARGNPWPAEAAWHAELLASLNTVVAELGRGRGIAPGRPKQSLLNPWLQATGTEGFVNPFALEVVLDDGLLPVERPFTLGHEWAHLAGYADESEASFVGMLACLRAESAALRYAGWLAVYQYLPRRPEDVALPALAPAVTADLRAIVERVSAGINPTLQAAQSEVYDSFLKANRVEAGIASYGLVLRLLLGTRFGPQWTPVSSAGLEQMRWRPIDRG